MADGPVRLVDHSGQMKHHTVVEMLEDVLADLKANPEMANNMQCAYLIMRQNNLDGSCDVHHVRAGFRNGYESLGYLQVAAQYRAELLRKGTD